MNPLILQMLGQMGGQQAAPSPIDINSIFGPIGQQIEAQQPYQEPVPQGPNPFASMGSIFAGTLADMLGARGAQQAAQARILQRQELPIEANLRNQQRQADMLHEKKLQQLDLRIKLADMKYQAAVTAKEDLKAKQAEAEKQRFEIQKLELQAKHDEASDLRSRETQRQVADIYMSGKKEVPGAEPTTKELAAEDDRILKMDDQAESEVKGSSLFKGTRGNAFQDFFSIGPVKKTKLSPEGRAFLESQGQRYLGQALSLGGPKAKAHALGRYVMSVKSTNPNAFNPDGTLNPDSVEGDQLLQTIERILPDTEQLAFGKAWGLTK